MFGSVKRLPYPAAKVTITLSLEQLITISRLLENDRVKAACDAVSAGEWTMADFRRLTQDIEAHILSSGPWPPDKDFQQI